MAMQLPSSSSSFSYEFTYQVFLSFRGIDTRHGFTGNLYKALIDKGIHTFIDDNDLQRGDEITPSLIKAIEESRIFIPVFSINYASSSFCLDELVHIIHCYKTKGRLVLPVFYGVEPTHIRHQTGSFGEHLTKHEEKFQNNKENMERLKQWKMALTKAANLSGYHYSQGYEYKFIGEIVKNISNKINRQPLHVGNYPVGMQSRVQQLKSLLDDGPDDGVHMVGIYGIGGLGKSTLARAVYNFVADQFEGLCFLHDVRENSAQNNLKHLQEKLLLKTTGSEIKLDHVSEGIPMIKERLCRKKILLILDDVDDMKQLHALAGGPDWFGRGSRVIITTRDKHLLTSHGIERKYAVKGLYRTDALELFRWMAFKNNKVPSVYEDVLNRAVSYASGLPLVLEIVGSNLFGRSIEEWKGTLDGYEKIPNKKIHEILKVSYDALEEEQQSVFLDIACCFKGRAWEEFQDILRVHYGHCITHHLGVLAQKSLVKISTYYHSGSINDVRLHDLIKDMGKELVRQESPKEPGERSRLWCQDDIVHVLNENTGTSKIEMIHMNLHSMESIIDKDGKAFKKMRKLKTLIIENGQFSKGLKYLPSSLRVLKWRECLSEALSYSIFGKKFQNMKVLTFDHCEYLTHIPDVSGLPNLEKLSFQDCLSLITIHNSVGYLNKLEILDVTNCIMLKIFPPLRLPSLRYLELTWCKSLNNFPELLCKMTNIEEIEIYGTSIGELPFSFGNLDELSVLRISSVSLKILPECLSECYLLAVLDVQNCESLEEIRGIPPNLKILYADECKSLNSSSRRMLLSQELHEAGCTEISFPNGNEGIPDWFEHQIIRGDTVSFWFRKKIPTITCIFLFPEFVEYADLNLFVNGYKCNGPSNYYPFEGGVLSSERTFLFDLELDDHINNKLERMPELCEEIKNNEWNHVELNWEIYYESETEDEYLSDTEDDDHVSDTEEDEKEVKILSRGENEIKMGIHVSWQGDDFRDMERDVVFTNPYTRKRNLDEYLNYINTSLSQFEPPPKKQRLVEVGVSETESLQQQQQNLALLSLQQQMALLPQQQRITVLSGMWNSVLNKTKGTP